MGPETYSPNESSLSRPADEARVYALRVRTNCPTVTPRESFDAL